MVTLLSLIIGISLLVLVHEWGHFYAARKLGVRVEEFGFGFPPRLFSRIRKGVRYSFNLFPFGGFVKIYGEHGEGREEQESFISRPAWQRFLILAAGVGMNIVLAWMLFSMGAAIGVPGTSDEEANGVPVSIVGIMPGSPAERAGLALGDQILEMRTGEVSLRIETESDVRNFVDAYRGEEVNLTIRRKSDIRQVQITPRASVPEGEGPIGIAMARLTLVRVPWYLAPVEGALALGRSVVAIAGGFLSLLGDLFTKGSTGVPVTGPVGIFRYVQDTSIFGFAYFLQLLGVLSVNLAILNFLPIPALDGGRVLFLGIEKVKGRRIDPRLENIIHTVGFAVLLILMGAITYKDIVQIW